MIAHIKRNANKYIIAMGAIGFLMASVVAPILNGGYHR